MISPALSIPFQVPGPMTHCTACRDPLYAGHPLRTVPGGAIHVGCYVLEQNRRAARHLELVPD